MDSSSGSPQVIPVVSNKRRATESPSQASIEPLNVPR